MLVRTIASTVRDFPHEDTGYGRLQFISGDIAFVGLEDEDAHPSRVGHVRIEPSYKDAFRPSELYILNANGGVDIITPRENAEPIPLTKNGIVELTNRLINRGE